MTDTPQPPHPYAALTPDVVLDALTQVGLRSDTRLLALSSYENRVYQVPLEDAIQGHSVVVVKFYRPGRWTQDQILEEHALAHELALHEIPVVAPLSLQGSTLHEHAGFFFSVSPRRGGRWPELDDFEALEWIGRFIARIHQIGAVRPFEHRPSLDLAEFGWAARESLARSALLPLSVRSYWLEVCDQALQCIAQHPACDAQTGHWRSSETSPQSGVQLIRLHGDCHPGNILWTPTDSAGAGPHFVDLDDARMGPAIQDLWMLLSDEEPLRRQQWAALLEGYETFRELDRRELSLMAPLRTLRQIHYCAWLASRWHDPTFPIHFPWFGEESYWHQQIQQLQLQIESMRTSDCTDRL